MRARPFISGSEAPRPFSEAAAERIDRRRVLVLDEISRLEGEAAAALDPAEGKRLQCQAEELRCALAENPRS